MPASTGDFRSTATKASSRKAMADGIDVTAAGKFHSGNGCHTYSRTRAGGSARAVRSW